MHIAWIQRLSERKETPKKQSKILYLPKTPVMVGMSTVAGLFWFFIRYAHSKPVFKVVVLRVVGIIRTNVSYVGVGEMLV